MKLIPSEMSPTRRKVQRNAAGSSADADASGTVVRLSTIGVVQVIRLPAELRFDAESVRLIRDGDRLIVEPVGKRAAPASPLPFRESPPESGPRPRRRAPDADARVPAPVGPKLGR
ncbi:MAG: hypothetical protein C0434_04315 [Xanthomonadaceae bacterium]|nr:hypothetical protein [Xanthomonadaceae bacterium]